MIGREEKRVNDNAVFRTLYAIYLIGLRFDVHIFMDNTNTALTRDRDRHTRFGHRVHRRSHQRGVQCDTLGQLGGELHIRGQHVRLCGNEQHVVKGQPFF